MKELMTAIVLTISLSVFFSCFGDHMTKATNGFGTQYKGDSGLIIPGDGDLLAEVIIEPESPLELLENQPTTGDPTEATEVTEETSDETNEETNKETKEEHNKMNGMLIAFWHGVAAVLVGEISALLVAFAWKKIRGSEDGK